MEIKMKCNRTVCNNPAHPKAIHKDIHKAYCIPCARKINELNGMILIPMPTKEEIRAWKDNNYE